MMTLDEFRASGVDCDDLGKALDDGGWFEYRARGRLYLEKFYIERRPEAGWLNCADGEWCLTLGRDGWLSDDLPRLEALLYEWALSEGYL